MIQDLASHYNLNSQMKTLFMNAIGVILILLRELWESIIRAGPGVKDFQNVCQPYLWRPALHLLVRVALPTEH